MGELEGKRAMRSRIAELEADYQRICRGHDQLHNERDQARDRVAELEASLTKMANAVQFQLETGCPPTDIGVRLKEARAVLNAPANAEPK